ncbi:MAG: DUF2071 domain-containing protein [Planctomycetia bacterium]|nr:DUF2071 domain-containing protein [Planctomycetia bacterium]
MKLPVVHGVIDRRMLVNYRVDAGVLAKLLPTPFEPKLHRGMGLVGICLIRLRNIRPSWLPSWLGIGSENAAHRAAVVWQAGNERREGVYVQRRDTNSRLNTLLGGRLFPGFHHHARFDVEETTERYSLKMTSDDGVTNLAVRGHIAPALPSGSVFTSLDEASRFFAAGSLGYSPTPDGKTFQGLELRCDGWHVEPLAVEEVRSSVFDDPTIFQPGSITFDHALLMRNIQHAWHEQEDLCCVPQTAAAVAAI